MKITVEMTDSQYQEMLKNKVKAEKYDKFVSELRLITSYPEVHPMSFVTGTVDYGPYINISSEELYKLVLSWSKEHR